MKRHLVIILSALIAGCTLQPDAVSRLEVGAAGTRAGITEDLHTVWTRGDRVGVFYNGADLSLWTYDGETGSRTGTIGAQGVFPPLLGATAVLPYDDGMKLSGGIVSTTVPAVQTFDGVSTAFAVMTAEGSSEPLLFSYASAVVSLRLSAAQDCPFELDTISLEGGAGEPLCGPATIAGGTLSIPAGGGTSLSLALPDGCSQGTYSFGIPPGTYPRGVVFTLRMKDGTVRTAVSSSAFSISAGELKTVSRTLRRQETLLFDFDFTTGRSPFSYAYNGDLLGGKHATSMAGDTLIASGTDSQAYRFVIFSRNEGFYQTEKAPYWFRLTTGSGETGTGPAWLKLPQAQDKVLSSVEMRILNTTEGTKTFHICDNPDGLSPLVSLKIAVKEGVAPDAVTVMVPASSSSSGDRYLWCSSGGKNANIATLRLRYR